MSLRSLFIFFVINFPMAPYGWSNDNYRDYKPEEKSKVYEKFRKNDRPFFDAIFLSSEEDWDALELSKALEMLSISDNKVTIAAKLCATKEEIKYLSEPLFDEEEISNRQEIVRHLLDNYEDLNTALEKLSRYEDVFTHILLKEQISSTTNSLFTFISHYASGFLLLVKALPYAWNFIGVRFAKSVHEQYAAACTLIVFSLSSSYALARPLWCYCKGTAFDLYPSDRFILDFAKAMNIVYGMMNIVKKDSILDFCFPGLSHFDFDCKINDGLEQVLKNAQTRLEQEGSRWDLWQAQSSGRLARDIQCFKHVFRNLYFALARIDAYLYLPRVAEAQGRIPRFVNFIKNGLPSTAGSEAFDFNARAMMVSDAPNHLIVYSQPLAVATVLAQATGQSFEDMADVKLFNNMHSCVVFNEKYSDIRLQNEIEKLHKTRLIFINNTLDETMPSTLNLAIIAWQQLAHENQLFITNIIKD